MKSPYTSAMLGQMSPFHAINVNFDEHYVDLNAIDNVILVVYGHWGKDRIKHYWLESRLKKLKHVSFKNCEY